MAAYKSLFIAELVLILLTTACKKETLRNDCSSGAAFVKEVKNVEGRVYFDDTQNKYMLLVANSMDSYDVGYVCDLPLKFQKAALAVRFSGRYFDYDKPAQGIAGNKYYYLSLDEITEK